MRSLLLVAAVALAAVNVSANELDNEKSITEEQIQLSADLPKTVVVRVNEKTKAVEVLHSSEQLPADAASVAKIAKSKFTKMDVKGQMTGELDRDSSSSSWYFCFNYYNWYYPTYYYYNYPYYYYPYYNYYYGGYNYYYSNWGYGGHHGGHHRRHRGHHGGYGY